MATAVISPQIAGFTGTVEQFAADHGITDIAIAIYDVACRLFPMARAIRVEVGEDYEDSTWRHLDYLIEDLTISPAEAYAIDEHWTAEVARVCPAEHAWLFTHNLRFAD
jgi:hypothetical protein